MTEGIVNDLEAVQVDEQHRKVALVAPRLLDLEVQHFAEHRPVGQRGELVVMREVLDALLGQLAHGDVLAHAAIALEGGPGAGRPGTAGLRHRFPLTFPPERVSYIMRAVAA